MCLQGYGGQPPCPAWDPVWTLPRCPILGCHLAEAVTKCSGLGLGRERLPQAADLGDKTLALQT